MKRILVTGGTGFIGANLSRRLLAEGHEVDLLVRQNHTEWRIAAIRKGLQLHEVELCDAKEIDRIVGEIRPDWVFHLAAYGNYSSQADVHTMVQANVLGTINLLEACLRTDIEAFVNTGSSSEYGFKDHAPNENEVLEPNSEYAVTKASATLFCCYYAKRRGVPLSTLRLHSVYGPYEDSKRLISSLIRYGLKGKFPPLVDPSIAHDFIYVEDVVHACILAASHPKLDSGTIFNVGKGEEIAMREVVDTVQRVLGITAKPEWRSMPNRAWDSQVWVADNKKIRKELGWFPRYSFEEGFRLTVEWFQDNPKLRKLFN